MALIFADGEWVDDGTTPAPPPQYNQGPAYNDGEWLGAASYAPPAPVQAVPQYSASFDYNPETPFSWDDWKAYQTPQAPAPNYDDYAPRPLPPSSPPDVPTWNELPSVDEVPQAQQQQPSPDTFKSDGSPSAMYEMESQEPDYLTNAFGKPTSPWARAQYAQADVPQGSVGNWSDAPDLGESGSFGTGSDWNGTSNAGSVAQFYGEESQTKAPPIEKPYVPYWEQEVLKPPLPYQEGYDPQVGSQIDIPEIMRANPNTFRTPDSGQAALGIAGAIPAAGYAALSGASNSDIPGVSQLGWLGREYVDQVLAPAGNLLTSTAGALSNGGDVLDLAHGAGPAGWLVGGLVDVAQGRDPSQYFKEVVPNLPLPRFISATNPQNAEAWQQWRDGEIQKFIDGELGQGKNPEEVKKDALAYGLKIANPFNAAEAKGLEDFSKLPAPAQLGIGLADPLGNKVYGEGLRPFTQGVPTLIGKAADATGLTKVAQTLDEKLLQAPAQKDYKVGLTTDNLFNSLNLIAKDFDLAAPDLARTFLKDTESPLYYGNLVGNDPKKLAVAQQWEQLYDALPAENPAKGATPAASEEAFGVKMQDTTGKIDPFSTTPKVETLPADTAPRTGSDLEFDNLKSAAPLTPDQPLAPKYAGVKVPDKKAADLDEWFGSLRTMQGVDSGALKLDKTLAKPGYRQALPLEEWGVIGKALRGANKATQGAVARPFLNTFSRGVIRDPLSNEAKLAVERPHLLAEQVKKVFGKSQVNATAERLYGKALDTGPSSITADVGTQGGKKANPIAELYYVAANPYNEIPSKILSKATGGRFKNWNTYSENRERNVKELFYNDVRLEVGKRLIKDAMNDTAFLQANPEIARAFADGSLTSDMIEKALSGKHFDGFDLNAARKKEYNPANTSPEFDEKWGKVLSGQAGMYGDIIYKAGSSIPDRVNAANRQALIDYLTENKYKIPVDGDLSRLNPTVLQTALANTEQVALKDVKPGHPIYEQLYAEAVDALDAARLTMFPDDPRLYDASYYLSNAALNYAADTGRYDLFSGELKKYQDKKEARYAVQFKAPEPKVRKPAAKKPPQPVNGMVQKILPVPNDLAALKQEVFEYRKLPGRLVPGGNVLKTIRGDGKPGDVVVRYQKDGATHFRTTAPDKLREGETIAWPFNKVEQPPAKPTWERVLPETEKPVVATTPPTVDFKTLADQVNMPPPVRLPVGIRNERNVNGAVLTPATMQEIAGKFTRKEMVDENGRAMVSPISRSQMNRYMNDFRATDQYYRKITNNQFKLDPDYLVPVRISDGVSLNELMGQPLPPRIGPDVTSLKGLPVEYLGEALKERYGEDVYKQDFSKMDPALRDTIIQEIGQEYFEVNPLDPIAGPKGNAEYLRARDMLDDLGADMQKRYDDTAGTAGELTRRTKAYDLDVKTTTEALAAKRAQIALQVNDEAYKATKGVYFDYRDKNRLDQALGSILPFQYWARQNFAYLAKHFAANPYQFAAVLNFYQELEKENSDPTIPDYQKSGILVLKTPFGENITATPSAYIPFNPLGNDEMFGGLAVMTDDQLAQANVKLANKEPLGVFNPGEFLFGSDKKNAQGKVIGRNKGLASSWMSPNPFVVDAFMETGLVNKWWQSLGVAGGNQTTLGQDYPEDTRAQHASLSFFPAAKFYASAAAATPVAGAMRQAGMIKGEFNPIQPLNEIVYGRNAGKPQTAIYQEVNRMVVNKEITDEQGKLAIAAYKDGSYNSVPLLAALDRVYADNLAMLAASKVGFSGLLTNTPRQQVTNKLYAGMNDAYAKDDAAQPGYTLDEKGNAVANKGVVSGFYDKNPAASVLSAEQTNDTPETIRAGIASDKAYAAVAKLKAQLKDSTIDYSTYSAEMNKLKGANPAFFEKNSYYNSTPAQDKQSELTAEYKNIGGDNFDALQTKAYALRDKGDEEGYKAIVQSKDYREALDQRAKFITDNPGWYKQYTSNNQDYRIGLNRELVGGLSSAASFAPKPAKDLEQVKQDQVTNAYYDIGGDKFDQMQAKAFAARDAGDDATYKKILSSPEYQKAQDKRNEFIFENEDWYNQYSQSRVANGGVKKSGPLPPTKENYQEIPRFTPQPPKSIDQIKQDQVTSKYYAIGGDAFDELQKKAYDLRDKGDQAGYSRALSTPEYIDAQKKRNQFIIDNPEWYAKYSGGIEGKSKFSSSDATLKGGTTPQIIPGGSLKRPKTIEDIKYDQQLSDYYSKGGAEFDDLEAKKNAFFDQKQDNKAYDIINSRDYQQVKFTQNQFKKDNPEFAKRFDREYEQKYGKPPKSEADQVYDEQKAQFYKIGGARYDQLSKKAQDAYDSGDKTTYYDIKNSREFKSQQAARDQYLIDNPDFADRYNADNTAKYGSTPKTDAQKEYDDLNGQYQNIGGAKYDALAELANQYYEAGNKSAYNAIAKSAEYLQAKAARKQFLDDHPDFAKQYQAELGAKYGPSTNSAAVSSGKSSSQQSSGYSSSSGGGYAPKKSTTSYSSTSAKNYNTQNRSNNTGTTNTKKVTVTSPAGQGSSSNTPLTKAQKAAYAYALNTLGADSAQAAAYARKVPASQATFYKPGSSGSGSGTSVPKTSGTTTPFRSVAALPKPTTSTTADAVKTIRSLPIPRSYSGGGGGGGRKPYTPPAKFHNFLPGPNSSLIKFSKRKRYK